MKNCLYDVNEKPPIKEWIPFSIQHVFAMFGSTILVPLLCGMSVATALFTAGLGTILYIIITQFKVPAFLGSSFAFIPALIAAGSMGMGYLMTGVMASGLMYCIVALIVRKSGTDWISKVLPPVVIGSVIVCIGMSLAPTAVDMAMNLNGSYSLVAFSIALVTLVAMLVTNLCFKGFVSSIPVLVGLVAGYLFTLIMGWIFPAYHLIDFTAVKEAAWLGLPKMYAPKFNLGIILTFVIVSFSTICEHIGDTMTISKIIGKECYKDPGLHRTLLGDGCATILAGVFAGPCNTTYGENVGTLALSKVYSVWVIFGAACCSVFLSFFPKFAALISTVPTAVLGGISLMLFGSIASSGLRTIVDAGIDYSNKRNLAISSVIMVAGIGGLAFQVALGSNLTLALEGVALATILGILMNLLLPKEKSLEK